MPHPTTFRTSMYGMERRTAVMGIHGEIEGQRYYQLQLTRGVSVDTESIATEDAEGVRPGTRLHSGGAEGCL